MKKINLVVLLGALFMATNAFSYNCPDGKSEFTDELGYDVCCNSEGRNCVKPIPEDEDFVDSATRKFGELFESN